MSSPYNEIDEESFLLAASATPSAGRTMSTTAKVALAAVISVALLSCAVIYSPSGVTETLAETATADFGVNAVGRIYDGATNSNDSK